MPQPVIVSAVRTATGKFGGALMDVSAPELGGRIVAEASARCKVAADQVDEVVPGGG